MQMLQQALTNAGASTEQINQFLTQAFNTGNQYQQQQIGNAGTAANAGTSSLNTILNYINQRQNFLPGVASNAANLSEQMGNASQTGLSNLSNSLANNNPFASLFGGGSNNSSGGDAGQSQTVTANNATVGGTPSAQFLSQYGGG
jgi:ABC-type transporter Mla subunit MlaD